MEGPTKDHLLYLGQKQEAELKLKTYQEQLIEVTRKRQLQSKGNGNVGKKLSITILPKLRLDVMGVGELSLLVLVKCPGTVPDLQKDDRLFIETEGWKVQKEIKYLVDSRISDPQVT